MVRPDFSALGKLGGRPRLTDKVTVAVSLSETGRAVLVVRFGETIRNGLGWTKKQRLGLHISDNKRIITLRPDEHGLPIRWKVGARSAIYQVATTQLPPFSSRCGRPYIVGSSLSVVITLE
jgi:hypothetical protein